MNCVTINGKKSLLKRLLSIAILAALVGALLLGSIAAVYADLPEQGPPGHTCVEYDPHGSCVLWQVLSHD